MKKNNVNICFYENERIVLIKYVLKKCDFNIDSVGIFIGLEGGFFEEEIE